MSPAHALKERRSPTQPIPRAAGSKFSQKGSTSTNPASSTSTVQTAPNARRPSADGPRIQITTAAISRPAPTGYDHELIA